MTRKLTDKLVAVLPLLLILALFGALPASAGEVEKTFDFELDEALELDSTDGPVTLHELKIDRKVGRVTRATLARPYNQEFLESLRFVFEYTNSDDRPWKAEIEVRWLDGEGRVIDGFNATEKLNKNAARKTVGVSLVTLVYGLERAETLEVRITFKR